MTWTWAHLPDHMQELNADLKDDFTAANPDAADRMAVILDDLVAEKRIPPYVREYEFHPSRKWRSDFAFVKERVLLEVEGGHWRKTGSGYGSGHAHPVRFIQDCHKYNEAQLLDWHLFRVPTDWLDDGQARELLLAIFPPF